MGIRASRLRSRLQRRLAASSIQEHNERTAYTAVVFQAIAGAGAMSFIAVFLVRLGAPNWLVGLYTSLPALVTTLTVLPAGSFVQRQRDLVLTANWGRFFFRAIVGLFALLPFLPPAVAPYALVGARCLMSLPGAVTNVSVTTIWGRVTTPDRRPSMLSTRLAVHRFIAAGVGLAAGYWLDYAPYPLNYQVLFASAFVAGLGSVYVLSRLKLPPSPQKSADQKKRAGLRELFSLIKGAPAFRNFALAALLFRLGMQMPSALYPIYRVRNVGCSDSWIGILLTVSRVVSVFAFFALSRLLKNAKYRRGLWMTCVAISLHPILTALSNSPQALVIPSLVGGLFGSGTNIFLTNTLFQVSPEDQRPAFVAANSFLANVTAFVAPLLGTVLADVLGIKTALVIAGAIRLFGGFAFWALGVGSKKKAAT